MSIWTLAKKELRLLLRDRLAVVVLLLMPLVFILILGLILGEGFGQKPDDRLRVSLVDLDEGDPAIVVGNIKEGMAWFAWTPGPAAMLGPPELLATPALALVTAHHKLRFPRESWAKVVQRDLAETAGIRVEMIASREEAEQLCLEGRRSAVLVFGPKFSERVFRCSFLVDDAKGVPSINPFYREGVKLVTRDAGKPFVDPGENPDLLDAELIRDPTQLTAASIIEQVAQGTLLRVILPWMIGKAFERISETEFIDLLAQEVYLPVPGLGRVQLKRLLVRPEHKQAVGTGVQNALREQFKKYELTGKSWSALTRSQTRTAEGAAVSDFVDEEGVGLLKRGAQRYQILVPSSVVMFAFFLVLTVGWLFVSERRQGTLKRLQAAPVSRAEILIGKLLPCYLVSVAQASFLLLAGKLVFGLRWGPEDWPLAKQVLWLLPVVLSTSLAAMGMALLVAALARTEFQVAIFGTLLALALAFISGCLFPRELMHDSAKQITLITPHAWALDAYRQLLLNAQPNLGMVLQSSGVMTGFGAGFIALAWGFLWWE